MIDSSEPTIYEVTFAVTLIRITYASAGRHFIYAAAVRAAAFLTSMPAWSFLKAPELESSRTPLPPIVCRVQPCKFHP